MTFELTVIKYDFSTNITIFIANLTYHAWALNPIPAWLSAHPLTIQGPRYLVPRYLVPIQSSKDASSTSPLPQKSVKFQILKYKKN